MKATSYVQVVPQYARSGAVTGLRCLNMSTRPPKNVAAGAVLLRLNIEIPASVFEPLNVTINVPVDAIARAASVTADVSQPKAGVA